MIKHIFIKYGLGKVLLSGVHFEYDPKKLNKKDVYLKEIIPKLLETNRKRERFFRNLIKILDL